MVKENKPRLDLDLEAWLPFLALKGAAGPWAGHVTFHSQQVAELV